MVYYFSGTGNTSYVARQISEQIGESLRFIPETNAITEKFVGQSLGILFPIYSWGVPPIVADFIRNLPEEMIEEIKEQSIPIWMVCTCGDETGNAPEMLQRLLYKRGLALNGAWSVIMPNTYVLLPGFDVDPDKIEKEKLLNSKNRIKEISKKILCTNWTWDLHRGSFPKARTVFLFPFFKKWGINPKKWHNSTACVKCGRCVRACPVKNISMRNSGPEWGNNCLSCLACYHICPYHAVEYGSFTKKKGQYSMPFD